MSIPGGTLIALLFAAMRLSEICGLDYGQAGDGDGYLQLTREAVEITLLRSKSRTEPVTAKIPRAENPGLVAALERWIAIAGIAEGKPLFRYIKKGGDVRHIRGRLKDGGVNVALKARIARYLQDCGYTPEAAAKGVWPKSPSTSPPRWKTLRWRPLKIAR